jgi:AcrR family transcriptional regulator
MVHSSDRAGANAENAGSGKDALAGRRESILRGAREVFARKGIAATMTDVALAANVSQGLAYRYFKDKDAIVAALVTDAVEAGRGAVKRISESRESAGMRLDVLISSMLESRRTHPEIFQLLQQLRDGSFSQEIRAQVREQGELFYKVLRRLIVEGQSMGEVAEGDPDQLAVALVACLDGLSSLALHEPERASRHFPAGEIVRRMLKPPVRQQSRGAPRKGERKERT